jgi:uracil-DNA glycosylase family 4
MTSDQTKELRELLQQTQEYVRYFGELGAETMGVESIEPTRTTLSASPTKTEQPPTAKQAMTVASSQAEQSIRLTQPVKSAVLSTAPQVDLFGASPAPTLPPSAETLDDIWRDIGPDCTRCALCSGRTQVVNTHGNPKARLMFVGEAPGADEDAQGKPFVGRAGQLLTKMIEAMGLKREEVIIGNVNRCRPPGNRQPTLEEAAICRPFLFREIAAVRPEVIVVMGNTALRNLLEVKAGISSVRGQFRDYQGIKVMPTFHPAYLLRDPSKKRETWDDLKKVMEHLDGNSDKAASG